MELKKIIPACSVAMFLIIIQCINKDLSPITLDIEGDLMHFKNENIQLTFDDFMYCKVEYELEGNVQSMNSSSKTEPDPLPPHFIIMDDQVYNNGS